MNIPVCHSEQAAQPHRVQLGSGTRKYHLKKPFAQKAWYHVANWMFEVAHAAADKIAKNIRRIMTRMSVLQTWRPVCRC